MFRLASQAARAASSAASAAARPAVAGSGEFSAQSWCAPKQGFAAFGAGSAALLGLAGVALADEAEHGLHSAQYPWPHEGMFDSYESNIPSCGQGYCALCSPCSASSASATPASPRRAAEPAPNAANPCFGAHQLCAENSPEPATAGRAAADAAEEAARAACDARRNMPGADLWGRRRGRRP